MYDVLKMILIDDLRLDAEGVRPDAGCEEAGLDSLATVELAMLLEKRFCIKISDHELFDLATVGEIANLMEQRSPHRLS